MPCTCNSICDHDCGSNQICTGHVPVCSNTYIFTSGVAAGNIIRARHIQELQNAIHSERIDSGRRFIASEPDYCYTHTPGDVACSFNSFGSYTFTGGLDVDEIILSDHILEAKSNNNYIYTKSGYGVYYTNPVGSFAAGQVVYADDVIALQTAINGTRNICICDSHCNCDPSDCGCNGECPSDDYYSYYP